MAYLTKVQINGVTTKDDSSGSDPASLFSWEYERTSGNQISELTMETPSDVNDLVTLKVGQTVEVWAGWTTSTDKKIFSGYISDFSAEPGKVVFTCKDKLWDLIRKNVNNVYQDTGPEAGVISAIAEDLIETYGGLTADVQATGAGTGETVSKFRCDNTDIWERLVALADAVSYVIFFDPENDVVSFKQSGFNDSGATLTVGTNIVEVPTWTRDTSRMVNDLRVDGAVASTQIRFPFPSGAGQIGVTTDFDTTGIVLTKTPDSVELIMDSVNPPTTIKEGGTVDASTTEFYYVDVQNKTVKPKTSTTFPANDYAIVNYTWLAPAPIHQTNPTSIATYGLWQKQVTLSDITSIADAETRTSDILSKFSIPFLLGELLVDNASDPGIELGDKVLVVDTTSSPTVNKQLVITTQTLSYPATTQEIQVGDEAIRLADWQMDVETRLKRIEELLSLQNQDLILELVDFQNDLTLQPRYHEVQTLGIGPDVGVWGAMDWGDKEWSDFLNSTKFILGHVTFGLLGTSELGVVGNPPESYWISQFENVYTEEFIDEDFKGVNTDATWTTSGSVTFTSGQIAESSPFDLNNGTITVAKLTSTVASGAFDYEMTADGTNWESCTSGTTKTFINTGTTLQWRATENAASTGEITKLIVTGYH